MMKKLEKRDPAFTIDLAAVEGDGSFQCPKCGMSISPEDESEDNYKILDTKVDKKGDLSELVISCNKCRSNIVLSGFQGL